MKRIRETDVIVWHEGDLTQNDANALDDAGPEGAELPRPGTCGWAVPADVLRRAAPRRDAGASPAAAEFHRTLLRAGAPDGSRVIY